MPYWGGVIPAPRPVWRERRSAGFHPEGHSHHLQTVREALFNWKKVWCPLCVHEASSFNISSFLGCWYTVFFCFVCVPGSVKCNRWTGPPSLASWYGSVRAPVGWGRGPGGICLPATATAASKCGTWLRRWTLLTKERRGRERVSKRRQMEERQRFKRRERSFVGNDLTPLQVWGFNLILPFRCWWAYRGRAAAAVGPVWPEHLPLRYTQH